MMDVDVYWFQGNDECVACSSMTGPYHEIPGRPHENCICPITPGIVRAELVSETRDLFDSYELLEEIGWLPRGGSVSLERNWSTGSTRTISGSVSGEGSGFGLSLQDESAESTSSGGSDTVMFQYDNEEGGTSQIIAAVYQVQIWRIIRTWRAHWSEGQGMDYQFETYEHEEERDFAGYHQIGV